MNLPLPTRELSAPDRDTRLDALRACMRKVAAGELLLPEPGEDVNNHIHTTYSFSPYSPAAAVWMARAAGLRSCGIMDHDSIAGAREFIDAGRIVGIATTIGVECRADCAGTRLAGRRINNPDQESVAYMAVHGIPHPRIDEVAAYFRPRIDARHVRNRAMTDRINARLRDLAVPLTLSYDTDILPLSMAHDGGSVTERHLLFALAQKLVALFGTGEALGVALRERLHLELTGKLAAQICDPENPHSVYDLLGALKGDWVRHFYIPATEECPPIREAVRFARSIGAIPAYAYLGDVGDSVTGDKKTQTFEDAYLDLLFEELVDLGFQAVTYMPPRNTKAQLARVSGLCRAHGLFEISGVDINSPRQVFVCPELRDPDFAHLIRATWALIGHERVASEREGAGFFSGETIRAFPSLSERTAHFAALVPEAGGGAGAGAGDRAVGRAGDEAGDEA